MSMTVENALAVIVALDNQAHKDAVTVAILREARSVVYERAETIRNNPRRTGALKDEPWVNDKDRAAQSPTPREKP